MVNGQRRQRLATRQPARVSGPRGQSSGKIRFIDESGVHVAKRSSDPRVA